MIASWEHRLETIRERDGKEQNEWMNEWDILLEKMEEKKIADIRFGRNK